VMAMKRGAVAVISVPTIEDTARRPWARRVEISDGPAKGWVGTDGKAFSRTSAIRGSATLNPDAAAPLFAAAGKPLAKIFAEANKTGGRPKGFDLKAKASLSFANTWKDVVSENVVAMLPGSDPKVAGEFVGMTAHLDHIGDHGKGEDKLFNGAMDNASGVATLLEVARAVVQDKPRRSVMFAALTGEEGGLIGSDYLARNPVVKGEVVGLVNFDMPVLTYKFSDVVAFGAENSTMGPVVAEAARKAGITLSPDPMPEEGLFTRSDHYRFVQQGVPAVFMMTGFAGPGEKAFRDFLKDHYHKPSDDMKLPFDWEAGALFAKVNYYTVQALANADERPKWYAGSFFGKEFAAGAAKAADPTK
ncbi:MAG: peptidase M28, partial [Sphingomonadales bacterium 39-62-4]